MENQITIIDNFINEILNDDTTIDLAINNINEFIIFMNEHHQIILAFHFYDHYLNKNG